MILYAFVLLEFVHMHVRCLFRMIASVAMCLCQRQPQHFCLVKLITIVPQCGCVGVVCGHIDSPNIHGCDDANAAADCPVLVHYCFSVIRADIVSAICAPLQVPL